MRIILLFIKTAGARLCLVSNYYVASGLNSISMSEKYKIYEGGLFFVTLTMVGWIDLFTRKTYCDELIKNINYCIDHKGLQIFSFCIMPSHLHIIAKRDEELLGEVLRDFKSFTAKKLIKMITNNTKESRKEWLLYMFEFFGNRNKHNDKYAFWQQNNHPFDLFTNKMIDQKVNYIHNNPVVAGYVNDPQNYIYSSANPFTELKLSSL